MPKHPRLILRGNRYYHRAAIPQDIKATYPKSEETFSLGTSDYQEALKKVRVAAAGVDRKFDEHRLRLVKDREPPLEHLSDEQIGFIADTYFQQLVQADEETRLEGFGEYRVRDLPLVVVPAEEEELPDFGDYIDEVDEVNAILRHKYAQRIVDEDDHHMVRSVLSYPEISLKLSEGSQSWRKLAHTLQEVLLKANEVRRQRNTGEIVETPSPVQSDVSSSAKHSDGKLLSEAKEEWIAEKSVRNWVEKTEREHRVWMDHFISVIGDKPIDQYGKADARQFKNLLMRLPANWNKKDELRGLKISDAAERAAALNLTPMSDKNINKLMGFVGAFWGWAAVNYDENLSNPFKGMKIKIRVKARDERDPFTMDELKAIFSSPLYTGCKSARHWGIKGNHIPKDHGRFWVPLIALYTGARSGEIIQLRLNDIREADGINYFHLTNAEEDQRLKTSTSRRDIPIHQDLIKIGLLDLVKLRRSQGEDRLFPELKMGSDGYYSTPYSRHFRRLLESLGIKKSSKEVFHSFRHNFEDACRESSVSKEIMDALQGHGEEGMSGRYGRGYMLKKLDEEIRKLQYRDIKITHLMIRSS